MLERRPGVEIREEGLRQAYSAFVDLAQTYGQKPSISGDMDTDERTFALQIPPKIPKQKFPDLITGKYFGQNTGTVELVYKIGKAQVQLMLLETSFGAVLVDKTIFYDISFTKTGYSSCRITDDTNLLPDVNALNELLQYAKDIKEGRKPAYVKPVQEGPVRSEAQRQTRIRVAKATAQAHRARRTEEREKRK